MTGKPRVIYWFRTDLRLHDSPALKAALDLKPECLYPIWCWDPHYVYRARVGPNRWQYLLDCQSDLSKSITKLNSKSKLFVVREAPQTVLPKLFKAWKISHVVFEKDTDAYARERDEKIMESAKEAGVKVIVKTGRTLYDPDELVKANGGKPTMSITQVEHAAKKIGEVPRPIPAPESLPDPGDTTLDIPQDRPSQEPDINKIQRSGSETSYNQLAGPNASFSVPVYSELGLKPATTPHRGGETLALAALDRIIADESYTATFSKPSTAPTAFSPPATTLLSPQHHFGSLSVRLLYWRASDTMESYRKKGKQPSTVPTNLIGQLLFRDMYFGAQAALGHSFAHTLGNSHCRFVPWHLPSSPSPSPSSLSPSPSSPSLSSTTTPLHLTWLQRWKHGRTGFPWIDALMRQLRTEGWIHHLGRHAVACFLTRGGCYIDWERGAEVFEEWLLDHEVACNAGNWQWLACVAFYAQFYRCYSPVAFPKKWDKEGAFVRRYVPELARFPDRYIYEPWRAPVGDQKKAGCVVRGEGRDGEGGFEGAVEEEGDGMKVYPKPMFDFNERRGICIEGMKNAYHIGLYGDDERVKNGSWRELFPDGATSRDVEGKKGKDLGVEEDEGEAKELGGETKGGDRTKKRKQGTLDGAFGRGKRNKV
ncbi:MAG: hypothetical protein Q9195_000923 [Heterodermia aff. obscurata]